MLLIVFLSTETVYLLINCWTFDHLYPMTIKESRFFFIFLRADYLCTKIDNLSMFRDDTSVIFLGCWLRALGF